MSRTEIGALVLRMQESFLATPDMTLSLPEAERRFGFDKATCEAILTALVESGVLMKLGSGRYARLLPRSSAARIRPVCVDAAAA
jgi:DNA-binding IclR family transcriptional regulator